MKTRSKVDKPRQDKPRPKSSRNRVKALLELVKTSSNVLVLISPDPDSIASSMVVKRLLWKRVRKTVIAYIGEIKRLDNLAMIEVLKIPLVKFETIDPEAFSTLSLHKFFEVLLVRVYAAFLIVSRNWSRSFRTAGFALMVSVSSPCGRVRRPAR